MNARETALSLPARVRPVLISLALLGVASSVTGQTPVPTPLPPDRLTLSARANVAQGSGARALGMGGAFLARADDATAASWNPAGLSYLRLPEVSFVYSGGNLNSHETTPLTQDFIDDRRHGHGPEFVAATYPLRIGSVSGSMQVSLQRQISFSSDRTIDEFFGSPSSDASFTRHSTIATRGGFDVLALGSGWQLTQTVRVGATFNRWFNGYDQSYDRPVELGVSHQESRLDLRGWNTNLGVIWTPTETLNIGVIYRTGFRTQSPLSRLRQDPFPSPEGVVVRERSFDSDGLDLQTELEFPAAVGVGASVRPRSALTLSVDYTRTLWSKGIIRDYFDLGRTGPVTIFEKLPYPTLDNTVEQEDTEQLRAGLEYVLIGGRLKVPLRIGYFNDQQYFRAIKRYATLGDGSVISVTGAPRYDALTAGAGIIIGPILVDGAYVYEHGNYTDLSGHAIRVRSHRVYASLIYRHNRH